MIAFSSCTVICLARSTAAATCCWCCNNQTIVAKWQRTNSRYSRLLNETHKREIKEGKSGETKAEKHVGVNAYTLSYINYFRFRLGKFRTFESPNAFSSHNWLGAQSQAKVYNCGDRVFKVSIIPNESCSYFLVTYASFSCTVRQIKVDLRDYGLSHV